MLLRKKIMFGSIILAMFFVVTGSFLVLCSGSEVIYIDTYSGRLKTVRKRFLFEQSHTSETDFSRLIKTYSLDSTSEDWQLAISHSWGIERLVHPEWSSTIYGTAAEACREFTLVCELGYVPPDSVSHYLKQLLQCMQEGRPRDMHQVLSSCSCPLRE